jgi:hypothetical protein
MLKVVFGFHLFQRFYCHGHLVSKGWPNLSGIHPRGAK